MLLPRFLTCHLPHYCYFQADFISSSLEKGVHDLGHMSITNLKALDSVKIINMNMVKPIPKLVIAMHKHVS